MTLARFMTVLVLVLGLAACSDEGDEARTEKKEGAKIVAYTVSKRDGDLLTQVGIVRFDEATVA